MLGTLFAPQLLCPCIGLIVQASPEEMAVQGQCVYCMSTAHRECSDYNTFAMLAYLQHHARIQGWSCVCVLQDCDVDAPDLLLDVELLKAAFLSVTARAAAEAEDGEPAASSSNPEFVTANPSAAAAAMYNTGFLAAVAAMAAPRSSNTGFVTATQSVSVSPWPAQVLMHPWRQRQLPLATVRPSASRLAQAG